MKNFPQFQSFVQAGFECTSALAENKKRLDLLGATKHDVLVSTDYTLLKEIGIETVREGFSWNAIDTGTGQYDFSRYLPILEEGKKQGIQQIWDLNHFDYPEYVDPFSEEFVFAFGRYAVECLKQIKKFQTAPIYITPLNEISFFAWIGADMGWWAPYKTGRANGFKFKKQLVKASLKAMDEIWEVDPTVRFIHVDPYMRRKAKDPASETAKKQVREFNRIIRYQAWDMIAGKTCPELGGDPKYLDIIGMNYYIHNQEWVISDQEEGKIHHQLMDWESDDRVSFAEMIKKVYLRYGRPILISESGSFGEHRERWWSRLFPEIEEALAMDLPVCGVCAYPILDRPESAGFLLPNSGLWDFECDDEACKRIPHQKVLEIIKMFNGKMERTNYEKS